MIDLPFLAYGLGLAVATVTASLTITVCPDPRLARGAIVLAANWVLGTVFALTTGVTDGWWFNLLIDLAAAGAVFYRLGSRWQAALAGSYCVQVLGHLLYGWRLAQGLVEPGSYYGWLTAIAWLQIVLVILWSIHTLRSAPRTGPESSTVRPSR